VNKEKLNQLKPLIGLLLFSIVISIISPRFLSIYNILNILRQTSINAIIAAGMTFVILTGGIDLSVGSLLAFCGAVSAALISSNQPLIIVLLVSLTLGTLLGLTTGIIISRGRVQAFIATLVTMTMLRGATLVFTQGKPINAGEGIAADSFAWLGGGYFPGILVPIYLMSLV